MPNPRGWHEGMEPITSAPCISTGPIHYPGLTSLAFLYTHGPTLVFLVRRLSALSFSMPPLSSLSGRTLVPAFITFQLASYCRNQSHTCQSHTSLSHMSLARLSVLLLLAFSLCHFSLSHFVTSSIRFVRSAGILLPQSFLLHVFG